MTFERIRARSFWAAAASAMVLALSAGPSLAADMKIGFITINDAQHAAAKWIAAEVEKRTNGALTGKVFPAGQLGSIARQIEGIQLGTQEVFITPPGFFIGINPAFQAADAPGLFDSFEHQNRTLNHPTVRDKFLHLADQKGILGVTLWSAGEGALATRDPIRTLADMKGKKLRVLASKMEIAMMQEFGITGVPMDYAEVLPAIQRRVVDGARSAIVVMGPSKFYTAAKYITITAGAYIPGGVWLSKVWYNKLPKEQRDLLVQLGNEVTPIAQKASLDITRTWEKKWTEEGGEVIHLSKKEQAEFLRRCRPLGDEYLGKNDKTKEMYGLIKAAAEATRTTN